MDRIIKKLKQLADRYRSLNVRTKAALWFTVCSFLQKGISFITVPIFTRLLSTEEYGTYTLYLSWLQIFTVLSSLYLYHGVTDNAMSKFDDDRSRFISAMQGLTITITTVLLGMVLLFMNSVQKLLDLAPVMILLMIAEVYVTPAFFFWSARQRFEYRYKRLVALTITKSFLNPVLGLIAVSIAKDKALARVASVVFVEAAVCTPILIYQFCKGHVFFEEKYWKYALTLALPMLPHYLSGIVLNHGDRIVISHFFGKTEVALYGLAYSIGTLVQLFVTAINSALTPWVYSKLKTGDIKSVQQKSRGVMLLIFLIAIGLMLVSPEVVLLFGSAKYADAVNVIPPVAGSVFFIFMYSFLSYPEFYYEKTAFLMIASLTAAALNLVLNFIFVPLYGYGAAAYTTLACYVIYSLGHYIVARRILEKEKGEKAVVDVRIALVLGLVLIAVSPFMHLVYPCRIIRFIIIFVGLVLAFLERKRIIALLNSKSKL
ncbi:MAG: oligosaccharide flippase family protein [Lachnospiraceae bacterium]|nr:oligosaccharide flippase family protein [Lachnospiraceae bacterium]